MNYLIGNITDIDNKSITLQTESQEGYQFIVPDETKYEFNRKYKIFIYKEMKLEKNNKFAEKYYAFLDKNEYFLFLFLLKINGIGPAIAINILGNNLETLLRAIIEENVLALSTMPSLNLRFANSIVLEAKKRKNKKDLLLLHAGSSNNIEVLDFKKNNLKEIKDNLLLLGYDEDKIHQYESQIQTAIKDISDKDEILKEAIKIMYENK